MKNKTPLLLFILLFLSTNVFAVDIPSQLEAGGIEATRDIQEKDLKLRKDIQTKKVPVAVENEVGQAVPGVPEGQKVLIKRIEVTGVKSIPAKEISVITSKFENKELSLREMQQVAAMITDLYRQKGLITSRAILPPQKVESGILKIEVIEGMMGKITVQGNKYYRTSSIQRKVHLKAGDPFNYNKLRTDLSYLNQRPDRKVKTVLTPGQTAGTTDLVLNVKDKLPIHVGFSYDNYLSRYLEKNRYQGTLTHNNLLGFDDIMTLAYQTGEGHNVYRLNSMRYLFPLSSATQIGIFLARTQTELGKEYSDLIARGKSQNYSIYFNHSLSQTDTTEWSLNGGFDYKNVYNFQIGEMTSRDTLRVFRGGIKYDSSDIYGRTIVNNEVDQGVPGVWGALDKNGQFTSRAGSGGQFTKNILDVLRLQKMPKQSTLLIKVQSQIASHTLTAGEQYQIGGIGNVRGYPPGEAVGDNGESVTYELSFPFYPMSKTIRAPFSTARVYDALRLAVFYDWGMVHLRHSEVGESKNRDLRSYGVGVRYDLPENFSLRVDISWPMDEAASDQNYARTWIKVSKEF